MLSATVLPAFSAYGVYITEIVAPVLILIGFRTRLASAVYVSGALFA
jgi:putative oxidoreductase